MSVAKAAAETTLAVTVVAGAVVTKEGTVVVVARPR
jgi:hypothetical protein